MTEEHPRTGAARDVPSPRPVRAPAAAPEPDDGTPLGRAARAVADTVGGLLGTPGNGSAAPGAADASSTSAALKDVLGAVTGAAAAGRERRDAGVPPAAPSPSGDSAGERGSGAFLGALRAAAAPRLPIRDAARLRAAYPGTTD